MKLRNRKTGKIVKLAVHQIAGKCYESLAEVNEDWEDYKESKKHWFITEFGRVYCAEDVRMDRQRIEWLQEIGNWFDSKEDADKVVEKFKAFKRLKDKGFRFSNFVYTELCDYAKVNISATMINDCINDDLELLFGGKE